MTTEHASRLSPAKQALLEQRLKRAVPGRDGAPGIPKRPDRDSAPLSFTQRQMWVIDQMTPGNPAYNMPYGYRLHGPLNVTALERSFNEIIKRHEVLRTTFAIRDGEPLQRIHPALEIGIQVTALDHLMEAEREATLRALASKESVRPFDLSRLPLIRVSLFRLGEAEHVLIVNLHHIVADGLSMGPLLDELDAFYRAFTEGGEPRPPELAVQYGDFALWQRNTLTNEAAPSKQLEFWRKQLGGRLPVLELPGDKSRPATQSFEGSNVFFDLPPALAQGVKALGEREGCTFFMTVLAAFQVLLGRYSGQEDLIIGTPVTVRSTSELEPLIGLFLNMVALRCDLSDNPTFVDLLKRTRDTTLDAFSHGDVPLEVLMNHLTFERDPSRNPIFQVALQVMSSPTPHIGHLDVSNFHFDLKFAQFDLTLHLYEEDGTHRGRFEYCSALFDAETIRRLCDHFLTLLDAIVREPERRIATLPLLSNAERRQLLVDWNGTAAAEPTTDRCLHQLIEAQTERTPDAVAVAFGHQTLTYRELNRRANQLAHHLRSMGVGPDVPVAVFVERSLEMLVGIVGILKAGGAYVPMDPEYPKKRLGYILEDSAAPIVLTQQSLVDELASLRVRSIRLDADWADIARESAENPNTPVQPAHLAYVLFTSGSTGRPKGVALEHRSAATLVQWAHHVFTPRELAAVLCSTSICFDLSVFEIFVTLSAGGRIVLARDALDLPNVPRKSDVTLINTVPSAMAELLRIHAVPPSVTTVNLAGEPLPETLVEQIYATTKVEKVYNLYGPTETTTYSTYTLVPRGRPVTVGRPIAGTQCYILDAHRNPVPIGVSGELYLAGRGLARGYHRRPDLTAERFVSNPFSREDGARMYRTGDACSWLPDGDIQYIGRLDHQVKLRGFRIELGEIEAGLRQHPEVREAVAVAREDSPGDKRLVAYVVAETATAELVGDLQARLRANLPAYMIPAAFVVLDAFPRTPNGKIDRKQLPVPERSRTTEVAYVAPRTLTEEILAGTWAEILDLERVGVEDDFFDLGGHSLLAMRVVSRMRQALGVELPLRDLFGAPNVARLAARIEALRAGTESGVPAPPLEEAPDAGPAELSFPQQRLWFLDQLEPGRATYVMPGAIEMCGALEVPVLERALGALAGRHESLRTGIVMVEGRPRQTVSEPQAWTLQVVDLSDEADPRERLTHLLRREAARSFDLTRAPLFRARLYRLAPDRHVLLLKMHHIISDGWSLGILFRELGELYDCFRRGEAATLPPLPIQYRDYALWQRRWLQGEALEGLLAHWRSRLAGAPQVFELPTDRPRPAVETHRGAMHPFTLPRELVEALRAFARREGATLYMTLLSGFTVLLSRYSGQQDILVGTPVANRNRAEIEDVVGCFINTLVLRADLSGDPPARELLGRMREVCLDAFAHQDLPFERLVDAMRPTRDVSRNPVVQVLFALQNAPQRPLELPGLTLSPLDIESGVAQVDLTLQVQETAAGLRGSFEYATDLFDEATIQRMAVHWRSLLEAMVAGPERRVSELPLLAEAERRQVLVAWNETAAEYPRHTAVHELFEAQVERSPEAVALTFEDQRLTYREVDRRSNQLAHHLHALGVGPSARVGLCVERSLEMVVGLLGVLKAGAAYVPLDPSFPEERLRFMGDDAQLALLVSTADLAHAFDLPREHHVLLDADAKTITSAPDTRVRLDERTAGPEDPAYVIYTSGSTGKPKGVVVPHRAVVNFLTSMAREPGLTADDVLVAVTTLSFDIAVLELLLPLTLGASVVIATHDETLDGRALGALLDRRQATVMQATPVTWRLLLEAGWIPEPGFKSLVGGEALPRDLADQLLACGVELWNMYGPTETTVWSTCARITDTSNGITIGKPIANTTVRLLDARRNLSPIGVPGELCIGGAGVALGYWNRPELSADRFIPDPFDTGSAATLYRTGDRARWRADGTLEHLGRLDDQVKVRGFRIEVGEVEAAVARDPAVREVAVAAREDTPGNKRLVAYLVVPDAPGDLEDRIRARIRSVLPEYMVPSRFVMLRALPRTENGKLDRKALPEPAGAAAPLQAAVAPRNPTEATVLGVFREVLERDDFGVFGNFFDLGGDSLMAARMVLRLRAASSCDVPLRMLFEQQTVAALAEAIDALAWIASDGDRPAVAGERVEIEL
jgi:amino acid adenylation domain-containing protein